MPSLSNDPSRCTLLNLASGPGGRGPFVIRQEGYPSNSMTLKEERFLLRDDGVWVLNLAVFALSEEDQQRFMYPTTSDAMNVLAGLQGTPVVEASLPEGASRGEMLDGAKTTLGRLLQGLKDAKPVEMP